MNDGEKAYHEALPVLEAAYMDGRLAKRSTLFPELVRIGPLTYRSDLSDAIGSVGNLMGLSTHDHLRIQVDSKLPQQQIVHTMLHEIMHACASVYQLDFLLAASVTTDVAEARVSQMATVLMALMQDNPTLVAWLVN